MFNNSTRSTMLQLIIIIILFFGLAYCGETNPGISSNECVRRIYENCNHETQFKDHELENVRIFLNYTYNQLADIKPDKPLCRRLHVRQDWKCLTSMQKKRLISVWKELYETGYVQYLADLHTRYWPVWHKSPEFSVSHRWLENQLELAMRRIDPSVALPYWSQSVYGTQPERSSIWQTFGTNGSYANGYCVEDGMYGQWNLVPCIKRHWSPRGTIYPWYTPEIETYFVQSKDFDAFQMSDLGQHFQVHLNIGGYEGQYSVRMAPYDVLFYLHHNTINNVAQIKWHLSRRQNLIPLDYNNMAVFEQWTEVVRRGNIFTDTITGTEGVPVKELFWLGFGDLCYITDQLVRPINDLMTGRRTETVPEALKRLPQPIVQKYYPSLLNGNTSSLLHMFEDVGDCNRECRPIPKPTFMMETEQGRRQFKAYQFDNGVDQTSNVMRSERDYDYNLWLDLNRYKYCSPYVTHY